MTKCRKSFMPECEYFVMGGCVSPFNCSYKAEESITTATSTPCNLYVPETDKDKEIARLQAENAELRARLAKAGGLPCKVGDTLYEPFIDRIREWIVDSIYVFSLGINVNCERKDDCRWHDHFAIREKYTDYNDFESRVCLTREAAEARLKELQGGER